MRHFPVAVVLAGCLSCAGCVPSLHPLFTGDSITYSKALVGTWKQDDGSSTWMFSQSKTSKKQYRIVLQARESGGTKTGEFVGVLVTIKDNLYLDLSAAEPKKLQKELLSFYAMHFLPVHTFWRYERKDGSLSLRPMDPQWIKKHVKTHADEIAHTDVGGRIILTAPRDKLQQFVHKHRDTKGAFMKPLKLQKQ